MNQTKIQYKGLLNILRLGSNESSLLVLMNDYYFPVSNLLQFAEQLSLNHSVLYVESNSFGNESMTYNQVFGELQEAFLKHLDFPKTTIISLGYSSTFLLNLFQENYTIHKGILLDPLLPSTISLETNLMNFSSWWMKQVTPLDALLKIPMLAEFWESYRSRSLLLESQEQNYPIQFLLTDEFSKLKPYLLNSNISKFKVHRVNDLNKKFFFLNDSNFFFINWLINSP
ncbi:MAG: hypothetical protein SFU98_17655 [Leptospiraceae bacterium]|nr:hypothetical protein [Leptospiraceae bacterium]